MMRVERWERDAPAPDARTLRRRMEAEGYSVHEWTDRPGTTYDEHAHAEDQSHWIVSGALALRVGGEEYTLRAGDRDYLPAGTRHTARVLGDEPVFYLIGTKE